MIIAAKERECRIIGVLADKRYPSIFRQEFGASQVGDAATEYVSFVQADLSREFSGDGSLSWRPWKWIVMSTKRDVLIGAAKGKENGPRKKRECHACPKPLFHVPAPPPNR